MMNPKTTTIKTRKRQAGLTLLELTVVLLVLIGLSGLILPYAQGYLQRTHDSTGNDNLWEINNAIGLFQAKYFELPEDFHTLGDPSGTYDDLMNTSIVNVRTVSSTIISSLTDAGINNVWVMKEGAANGSATFDAVSARVPLDATVPLAVVTVQVGGMPMGLSFANKAEHLAYAFYNNTSAWVNFDHDNTPDGVDNCYEYIAFGVGPESEMVGKVIADAPLHFASQGGMGPENSYNRFVAVFRADKSNNTTIGCSAMTEPATLVGAAMLMMPKHLWGAAHTQAHTWENLANKNN